MKRGQHSMQTKIAYDFQGNEIKIINLNSLGLMGQNFYLKNKDRFNVSDEKLAKINITDEDAWCDWRLAEILVKIDKDLHQKRLRLVIKDAYRPKDLYLLIAHKRGSEFSDKAFNLERMYHSTGLAVDLTIYDEADGKERWLRDGKDDPDAWFINYYENNGSGHPEAGVYTMRQKFLKDICFRYGLKYGTKNEYFHFELEVD